MSNMLAILAASGSGAAVKIYADDVFSAFTYTGTGAAQTITTGVDIAGKGGMIWIKDRTTADKPHVFYSTNFPANTGLTSSGGSGGLQVATEAQRGYGSSGIGITGAGFTLKTDTAWSVNNYYVGNKYMSWTFRIAPKFFDIQTWTGTGAARTVTHSLGAIPGMIFVKRTDVAGAWQVYHRSIANTEFLLLNTTDAKATDAARWNSTTATASVFSLGTHVDVNANAGTYVAYIFGHDTSADGLIQCGTEIGNYTEQQITLGWEPQFLMVKSVAGNSWFMLDTSRAFSESGVEFLRPNTAEVGQILGTGWFKPNAAGFKNMGNLFGPAETYIYMAIRRPNKPPTLGTQVYNAIARTGTGAAATVTGAGFPVDLAIIESRDNTSFHTNFFDRLRGAGAFITPTATNAETTNTNDIGGFDVMDGYRTSIGGQVNGGSVNFINWFFKRAPGFMDVVCYADTNVAHTEAHNLKVVPELMIVKSRSLAQNWVVYVAHLGVSFPLFLNSTSAGTTNYGTIYWNGVAPTATDFTVRASSGTYIAYLFATLAGISKVFNYTGNGTSQTIACGFSNGARFILIKRIDAIGDWFVFDTVRGIVAGNDPHLSMNTTASEVTTDDSVDPDASGFVVNQLAATNINVSAAIYIGLAIA